MAKIRPSREQRRLLRAAAKQHHATRDAIITANSNHMSNAPTSGIRNSADLAGRMHRAYETGGLVYAEPGSYKSRGVVDRRGH